MKVVPYGSPVMIHDGSGHWSGGLVFSTRYDLGGPDDEPVITGVKLDPRFEPSGAARGNFLDAVIPFHDLSFVESADKPGWSWEPFPGEVRAQLEVKKPVLAAPVQPALITPPQAFEATQQAQTPDVAIVGGFPVEVAATEVEGVHEMVQPVEPEPPVEPKPDSGEQTPV